jgi:murein DD-endopeptidase MepM/ murein hydrolase activator NlpD
MSCCPAPTKVSVGTSGDTDVPAQDTDIRKGESVDCYMKRSGNTTGRMDDKTEEIPNKIRNTDIPLTGGAKVGINGNGVQFEMTHNGNNPEYKQASRWEMKDDADNIITNIGTTVTFTSSGLLKGQFAKEYFGKSIKIKITAKDSKGEEIDTRAFTFSPALATGSNEIKFIHPLPGSIVTSKFGPRRPPTTGASSQHGGADFALPGGKIGDILAAADGEVEFTGFQNGGAGNYIKVKHLNGAGKHLCTTVYMHLNKIYVSVGQKVSAGQKIGLEGNTGVGTGAHLHFECRLPSGTKVDPVPYIRGSLDVAQETNPDNTAKAGTIITQTNSQAVLTKDNVDARENGCEAFGPEYPKDPNETNEDVPPNNIEDPFERAWFFTMQHEVGPHWSLSSPNDPEVSQGLIETPPQRKKTGYVNTPGYPGGETKFGIAQGPNPSIKVNSMNYASAKKTGLNNYWKRGPEQLSKLRPRCAIMLFDMNYLHGVGNANIIKRNVDFDNLPDLKACEALQQAQQAFMQNIVLENPQRQKYINGWLKRSRELLAYAKSI